MIRTRRKTCNPAPKQGRSLLRPERLGPPAAACGGIRHVLAVRMSSANGEVPSPRWASSLGLFGCQPLSSLAWTPEVSEIARSTSVSRAGPSTLLQHTRMQRPQMQCARPATWPGAALSLEVLLTGGYRLQGAEISWKSRISLPRKTEPHLLVKHFFRVMGKFMHRQRFKH